MPRLVALCLSVLWFVAVPQGRIAAQSVPTNLQIRATAGGVDPWEDVVSLQIDADGQSLYTRYLPGDLLAPPLEQQAFTLSDAALERIWQAIQDQDFFSLEPAYRNDEINARTFARLSIQAGEAGHEVTTRNTAVHGFDRIVAALNRESPEGLDLAYDTSPPPFIYVKDPCSGLPPAASARWPLALAGVHKEGAVPDDGAALHYSGLDSQLDHPASVVHANLPLREAVGRGIARLESKGRFFGDGVAITVDNRERVTSDEIGVSLYLEFWGPTATPENVQQIEDAIERTWTFEGLAVDAQRTVDVRTNVVPRLSEGASAAPGTPGYHQVKLQETGRSNVVGLGSSFDINRGTGSGTWRTTGPNLDGMYAHEAGHLLGLPDRYDEYTRTWLLGEKPWTRERDGARLSDEDLAQIIADSENQPYDEALSQVQDTPWKDFLTIPRAPELRMDLMASSRGFVDLDDVVDLVDQAGLLVYVQPGDVFVSKNPEAQNLVATRLQNVFAPAGEVRRLDGIYAACMDAEEATPSPGQPMDLGLPLDDWRGVRAAELLRTYLQTLYDRDEYCLGATLFGTWRLTDNTPMSNATLQDFMAERGIVLGEEFLDFPRLSNPNQEDTTTGLVLPPELFVTHVTPQATLAEAGQPVTLTGRLTPPAGVGVAASTFQWTLAAPAGSAAALAAPQSPTAQFTPDVRGIYQPVLAVSVTPDEEMTHEPTMVGAGARVVVADAQTDTFERDALTSERFPWRTGADAPWALSDLDPHTGSLSARSGAIGDSDSTTLQLRLVLSEPGTVSFAYRVHAEKESDYLRFAIDGVEQAAWTGVVDWNHASFALGPGRHTLSWTYVKDIFGGFGADAAWIDDVFLPVGAVATAADPEAALPAAYALAQNFPNPFNPITTITYALPESAEVTLAVYDLTGRTVATLATGHRPAGHHQVRFDAAHLPSGVYYYRLTAGRFSQTRRMVVLK